LNVQKVGITKINAYIMFIDKDVIFLVEDFVPNAYLRTIKGDVYSKYLEAERILRKQKKQNPRGCTCQYKHLSSMVNSLWDQHGDAVKQRYEEIKEGT